MGFLSTPGVYMDRMITYLLGGAKKGSIFGSSPSGCLQWLDDTLIYAPTFHEYLSLLETVLKNCVRWKLRLNISKCNLIAKQIEWCGRELCPNGMWKYKTAYFDKVLDIPKPVTVEHLETVVYISTWLGVAIPRCAQLKGQLQQLMLRIKQQIEEERGKRVSKKLRNKIELSKYWNEDLQKAHDQLKRALHEAAERQLSCYDMKRKICIYTDASYDYWAGVLAQENEEGHPIPIYFVWLLQRCAMSMVYS